MLCLCLASLRLPLPLLGDAALATVFAGRLETKPSLAFAVRVRSVRCLCRVEPFRAPPLQLGSSRFRSAPLHLRANPYHRYLTSSHVKRPLPLLRHCPSPFHTP